MRGCRRLRKTPLLFPGDTVGIIAPASYLPKGDEGYLQRGVERLREMGFAIKYSPSLLKRRYLYLAGEDGERAQELMGMFLDPEVKAILCTRGGYGAQRIIPYLDPDLIRDHPKPFVGCSDITVLLIYLLQRCSLTPFHGPNVATRQFVEGDEAVRRSLKQALTSPDTLGEVRCSVLRRGEAQGEIIGGCFSSLVTTLGTPYEIDLRGKILFLEDVDEPPYKIDRMLTHLKSAGKLMGVKGIIFGQMPGCDSGDDLLQEMILDVFGDFEGPLLFGFPSGHGTLNLTIPLGVNVLVEEGVVTFQEGGVE
ncbi:MAG: LD-carboxypeptidase [Deltaproteobacteria bacterium]|nr:LD-carboxypeptidase [Deltaproteobacteria bacterium]